MGRRCPTTFRFQAGHIPSCYGSCERSALPPVAADSPLVAAVAVTVAVSRDQQSGVAGREWAGRVLAAYLAEVFR